MGGWGGARPAAPYMAVPYGAAPYGGYVAQPGVASIPTPAGAQVSGSGGAIGGMGGARFDNSPGPSAIGTPMVSSIHPPEDPLAPVDVNQANEAFISGEEAVLSNTELGGEGSGSSNSSWRQGGQQVFAQ